MDSFQIRDARANDRYFLDNELVDVYGKQIGAYGLAVYNVLARYANNTRQDCYPSYKTIGEALDISRNAVIAAIKKLEIAGLISTEKRISHEKGNPTTTNIYTLLAVDKSAPDKQPPSTSEVPGSPSQGLPSTSQVPGVIPQKDYPSTSEVPELNLINQTNSNQSSSMPPAQEAKPIREPGELTRRPLTSESDRIADYFARAINSDKDSLTRAEYIAINKLVSEDFTLERCKPGIDATVNGIRGRGEVVGSFLVCMRSIRQLDPLAAKPVSIQTYQKPAPFEQPKKVFREEDYGLTDLQKLILEEKREKYLAEQREIAESRERRLARLAREQASKEPARLQA